MYEFNPFGNSVLDSTSAATIKGLQNFSNVGQGGTYFTISRIDFCQTFRLIYICIVYLYVYIFPDFSLKPLSVKQNLCNAQVHSSAALPKLRTGCDSTIDNLEKHGDMTNYNKNMNLPNIKKQDVGADQVLARDRIERRKIFILYYQINAKPLSA